MSARGRPPEVAQLVRSLEQVFGTKGWHGTTLLGALRGLRPADAVWRPAADRHCIWELILHTAYWKYAVRRQLTGAAEGGFPRQPSNWPALPETQDARALKRDIALLKDEHQSLLDAVAGLSAAQLNRKSPRGTWTWAEMIAGVTAHDAYHTGQIQLLKRLR